MTAVACGWEIPAGGPHCFVCGCDGLDVALLAETLGIDDPVCCEIELPA